MKIFKQLNKKGYKHYYEGTIEELDSMDKDNQHLHSEIMQVVMWLYKKHEIWVQPFPYDTITAAKEWTATILSLNWGEDKEVHYEYKLGGLNSPTEAYEAAIEYCLNNLI